jgi:hypothetical protein
MDVAPEFILRVIMIGRTMDMIRRKHTACFIAASIWMAMSLYPYPLPSEISEFYEDYNFVASFSTPSERDMLIGYFSLEILPEEIRSERLNRVFRLMKKLHSRIARLDPKMMRHLGPRNQYIKYFFRSELLEIKKVDTSGKKATVEILAYSLEPEFVNRYIQQYAQNQREEDVPSDEERIESVKSQIIPKTEFHVWLFLDGNWMKAVHKNIFIKN